MSTLSPCLPPAPPPHTFQLWVLTEQHGKRVEELQAELRQKEVQLGQAQQGRQAQEVQQAQHAQQVSGGRDLQSRVILLAGGDLLQEEEIPASPPIAVVQLLYRRVANPPPHTPRLPSLFSQAKAEACAEVKAKVQLLYQQVDALQAAREGILAELVSMQVGEGGEGRGGGGARGRGGHMVPAGRRVAERASWQSWCQCR